MDQGNHDWIERLIKQQDEYEKDVNLGPAHLEKTISKKQEEGFLPQKVLGVNRRRKDATTKGRQHGDTGDDDRERQANFKKEREKIYERQEIEAESMPESVWKEEIKYLREADYDQSEAADDARDGLVEFRHLARGGSHFTYKEYDGYSDTYPDPTMEELRQIEADERREREQTRKIREFNESKPVKSGAQKVRKIL